LIDGGPDDERGTEEAEEDHGERQDPERGQHYSIAHTSFVDAHALIREDRPGGYHTNQRRRGKRPGRQVEAERALLEDEWAVRKKCLKNPVKHGCKYA
jgi:hypothetical protein